MKKIFLLAVCFVCLVGNLVAQDGLVFNKFQKKVTRIGRKLS